MVKSGPRRSGPKRTEPMRDEGYAATDHVDSDEVSTHMTPLALRRSVIGGQPDLACRGLDRAGVTAESGRCSGALDRSLAAGSECEEIADRWATLACSFTASEPGRDHAHRHRIPTLVMGVD